MNTAISSEELTSIISKRIDQAAAFIKKEVASIPSLALILGSGLGELAEQVENAQVISYTEIPGFPVSTAPGHKGDLVFGKLGGRQLVLMQGRIHAYEGYSQLECTIPIAVFHRIGIKSLIVTAASGGLNHNQQAGDLMLIRDHINFTGTNPLIGPNNAKLGPRFPVMFDAYDPEYIEQIRQIALKAGIRLHEGVYAGITGPVFLTKSELRMLMLLGADSLGMSVVPEVILARHRGIRVAGIAVISDMAIPDAGQHATEEEVLARARETGPVFQQLLTSIISAIG